MFGPVARVTSGLVIAPFLLFSSELAPLHEHAADAGHSHALVHSHLEDHHHDSHESDGPEVERGVERVIWLDSPIVHQLAYQLNPDARLAPAIFELIPSDSSWSPTPFDNAAPVHGPPRPDSSLRGPPAFPA